MRLRSLLVLLLVSVASAAPGASSASHEINGDAYDRRGQVRYREHHSFDQAGASFRQVTVYRDPAGQEIGRMEADYSVNGFAPDYRMLDYRHDSEEVVRRLGDRLLIEHRVGERRRSKTVDIDPQHPLVVGPGINEFIRAHWDELLTGNTLVVDFVVPSRLTVVSVRIRREDGDAPAGTRRFLASADNLFIRLLAPELEITYDAVTRRVVSYAGPSNVNDERNEQQNVVIRYTPGGMATAADAAAASPR